MLITVKSFSKFCHCCKCIKTRTFIHKAIGAVRRPSIATGTNALLLGHAFTSHYSRPSRHVFKLLFNMAMQMPVTCCIPLTFIDILVVVISLMVWDVGDV